MIFYPFFTLLLNEHTVEKGNTESNSAENWEQISFLQFKFGCDAYKLPVMPHRQPTKANSLFIPHIVEVHMQ